MTCREMDELCYAFLPALVINCQYQQRPRKSQREDSTDPKFAFAEDAAISATRSSPTTGRCNGLKPAITSRSMGSPGTNSTDMTLSVRPVPGWSPAGGADFLHTLRQRQRLINARSETARSFPRPSSCVTPCAGSCLYGNTHLDWPSTFSLQLSSWLAYRTS